MTNIKDNTRHFETGGDDYRKGRPTYPDALVEWFGAMVPDRSLAVDVGCGTGQLSHALAHAFDHVAASDVSSAQIAHAMPRDNIRFTVGSAEAISDVSDHTAALIVAAQAAHWFDLPAFYREVRRMAKEDALVALVTYGVFEVDGPVGDRLQRFYWNDIHAFWPPGREHVERGYADLPFPFPRVDVPDFVIERVWDFQALAGYIKTWSAVKRAHEKGKGALIDRALADMADLMSPQGTMSIRWPLSVIAGRVSRS